jgi:hypothetical protein
MGRYERTSQSDLRQTYVTYQRSPGRQNGRRKSFLEAAELITLDGTCDVPFRLGPR